LIIAGISTIIKRPIPKDHDDNRYY
jgi:hypothetical protein